MVKVLLARRRSDDGLLLPQQELEQLKPPPNDVIETSMRAAESRVPRRARVPSSPSNAGALALDAAATSSSITDPHVVQTLLQAVLLFAFGGFLSLSETALTTLWPWKIKELANEEGPSSPFYAVQQKRDSVFDDDIDCEHGEFDFSDGDDDRGCREGVRGGRRLGWRRLRCPRSFYYSAKSRPNRSR